MRKCVVPGCENSATKRGVTCGPDHAHSYRYGFCPKPKSAKAEKETLSLHEEHKLKRENRRLREQIVGSSEADEQLQKILTLVEGSFSNHPEPPKWAVNRKQGRKQGTPLAFMSDMHYGEEVDPAQIEGMNGYNRPTALLRTKNFFQNTVEITKNYLQGLDYPGIVLALGGDTFSGDIHEELQKTNSGTIQEELLYWIDPMIAGITLLADEFGKVHVPAVVGNHPRSTRKPSHKMRVPNNFDWLFYCLLAKFMKNDHRVTFQIGQSADVNFNIYSTRYRLSHGDQFKGGSGIAGALSPMMIGDSRKRKRAIQQHRPYDYLMLAHWHQYFQFKGILVNGSIKGYDEYAYHSNFDLEPPQQSLWITDPDKGKTLSAPVHVLGKNEFWMKDRKDGELFK